MQPNLEEKKTRLFDLLSIAMKYPAMRVKIASMSSFFSTQTRNDLSLFGDSFELEEYIEDILSKFLEIDKKTMQIGLDIMQVTRERLNGFYDKIEFRDVFSKSLTRNGKLRPPLTFADFVFAGVQSLSATSSLLKDDLEERENFHDVFSLSLERFQEENESLSPCINLGYVLIRNATSISQKKSPYIERDGKDLTEEIFLDART